MPIGMVVEQPVAEPQHLVIAKIAVEQFLDSLATSRRCGCG